MNQSIINNTTIFNTEMQTTLIYSLLHLDVLSRTDKIIKSDYFSKDLQPIVKLIKEFYSKYNDVLPISIIKSYIDENYVHSDMTESQKRAMMQMMEKYCKHSAIRSAINETASMLEVGDYGEIERKIREAISVSLATDAGYSYFDEKQTKERLDSMSTYKSEPMGYRDLDIAFDGGIGRKEMFLVLAKSGGGKSLFMLNAGHNFVMRGYNVLYITLELAEYIVMQRYDSIISGYHKLQLAEHRSEVENAISESAKQYGKFYVKRLPQSVTCSNDIRNCIRSFEIEVKKTPDVIIVDYLDLMATNSGANSDNLFTKEKYVAEELREVFHDFNAVGISACQYNRSAHTTNVSELSHANISGGISKINTSDNCIALWQTEEERSRNEYVVKILKSRNSGGVDKTFRLKVNPVSLRISDFNDLSSMKNAMSVLHN